MDKFSKSHWWVTVIVIALGGLVIHLNGRKVAPEPAVAVKPKISKLGPPLPMQNRVEPVAVAPAAQPSKSGTNFTQLRARIFDADDILAELQRVRIGGTPDERWVAHEVLLQCMRFVVLPPVFERSPEADASVPQDLRDAYASAKRRCDAIYSRALAESEAWGRDLPAISSSPLYALSVLKEKQRNGDDRWNQVEMDAVSAALNGRDAVMRREASEYSALSRARSVVAREPGF